MRLNNIYIKGFKSFPKETILYFNEKVTGVVGPNGSGKSNIVDAIRWVLGEQKPKELRLDTMSDVLFNGTKMKKKSSMAQVTLTFDNTKNLLPTEYNTVAISRILFRSGESEYRINDVPCRLKDVRSLFLDTGIGSESYAIIALNMVEDILADNNGSRRLMFEQSSGISKFKKRKKETLAKLKLTKTDLDRIEDLLFEIENNLKELKKQANKAERYLKIMDQYKDLSIKLQLLKYDNIVESQEELLKNINSELSVYRELETKITKNDAQLQVQKKQILNSEKNLSDFQRKINDHLDALRKNENEKQLLKQKLNFDKNKIKEIVDLKTTINENLKSLSQKIDSLKNRDNQEEKKLREYEYHFESADKSHKQIKDKYEKVKGLADRINREYKQLEESKFQLIKTKAISQNNIDNFNNSIVRSREQIDVLTNEIEQLKIQSENFAKEKSHLQNKLEAMEKKKGEKVELVKQMKTEKDLLVQDKNKIGRKLDARKNEYRLVKSMIDNLEGFPESIKYLNKNWNDAIPLLTDIISTTDEYKVAIETYLEPYLNYFIADNSIQAREAIGLLRKTQKGKAHFFILSKLKSSKNIKFELENFIPALDIVEFDEKYKSLVNALLGNVFISIVEMDEVYTGTDNDELIIIDKSGSFISGGYQISGGSLGLFEGKKIGRKKNLEKLSIKVNELEKSLTAIEREVEKKQESIYLLESESNENEISELKNTFDKMNSNVLQSNYKLDNKINTLNNYKQEVENNLQKIEKIQIEINQNEVKAKEVESKLNNLLSQNKNQGDDVEGLMEKVSKASSVSNNAKIELIRQQNLISTLKKDLEYKLSDLKSQEKNLKLNEELSDNLSSSIIRNEKRMDNLELILIDQYKLKKEYESDLSGIEKEYFENRNIVSVFEDKISKYKHQLTKSQYLINQLKEKQLDLDFKMKSVNERLKIEFNIELNEILEYERTEEDEFLLEDKVGKLRNRLDNYGEVNTLAVEAYNEMMERNTNIQKQRQDILDAEKSLVITISEIEKTATERFLIAFEEIRKHFKHVFETLFKEGDTSDLFLEEPDKPLESKILIIAKPKGKRPKTLSQLSGGEKTLTAIALLFSLYLYKPAPFCIFDEVDAPLDDANIAKFNNIVREFSSNSQFIVVTHNKATMASVDILYGVFMQELGISQVAQVDFRNFENLHTIAN